MTDPRVGLFLPCRITVVEQNGKVKMMAVNPKRLSKIFNNSELNAMCGEMTRHYLAIMEEAAL
jgi:cytochrome c oxidase cbb3-type subunit 3